MGQGIYRCALTVLLALFCCAAHAIQINEIRIDQPGTDLNEYFELIGEPGESLDGLSYLVIGDGAEGGSGVVEVEISLDDLSIPDDGFFLAAEQTFSLKGAIPDLITSLNFENGDNLTHLLVSGLDEGILGTDFDIEPDDGILDAMPWGSVLDAIGLIESLDPPTAGEFFYGASLGFIDIGPSGGFVPSHIFRSADEDSSWVMGEFDPANIVASDTPGESNTGEVMMPDPACDLDFNGMCDVDDLGLLTGIGDLDVGVESGFPVFYDINGDNRVDLLDVDEWLLIAAEESGFSSTYLLGDANLDGTVDVQDLNAVGLNWLQADKEWSDGNFNGDGIVNVEDLNKIGLNWLQSVSSSPAAAAVPEPATLVMLIQLVFLGGLARRQRMAR